MGLIWTLGGWLKEGWLQDLLCKVLQAHTYTQHPFWFGYQSYGAHPYPLIIYNCLGPVNRMSSTCLRRTINRVSLSIVTLGLKLMLTFGLVKTKMTAGLNIYYWSHLVHNNCFFSYLFFNLMHHRALIDCLSYFKSVAKDIHPHSSLLGLYCTGDEQPLVFSTHIT